MTNQILNKYSWIVALGLLFSTIASSCGSLKAVKAEAPIPSPTQFSHSADSLTGIAVTKQLVFTDSILIALIQTAVKNNPDVLIAEQRINSAKAYYKIRKGALLPTIGAGANAGARKYGDYTIEGVGNYDTNLSSNINDQQKVSTPIVQDFFLGLSSSWEIDLWGKLGNMKKAAKLHWLASTEGRNLVVTTIVAEVAFRYYDLLALDAKLEILQQNLALQDSIVQIAIVQQEVGRATMLAVQQFQAQHLRTQSAVVAHQQEIIRVENELNILLGQFPQHIARSKDFPLSRTASLHLMLQPQTVLQQRPDILKAEWELKATKADVAAAKAALLPALTLAPSFGYSSFNSALLFNPASLAFGVISGLAAPLVNRSAIRGTINQSKAAQQEAYHSYYKTILHAYQEIETTLSNINKLNEIYNLNAQETILLTEAVATSNELYKAGFATYLEVITSQRNALEANFNIIETQKSLQYNLVTLYRAIGGNW